MVNVAKSSFFLLVEIMDNQAGRLTPVSRFARRETRNMATGPNGMLIDRRLPSSILSGCPQQFSGTHMCTPGWRKPKYLAHEHNIRTVQARFETRTYMGLKSIRHYHFDNRKTANDLRHRSPLNIYKDVGIPQAISRLLYPRLLYHVFKVWINGLETACKQILYGWHKKK